MAFKFKGNKNSSSSNTAVKKKSSTPKRGVGNYNILNFGNASLVDCNRENKAYDFRIHIKLRDDGAYDESDNNYTQLEAAAIVTAGLTCTKKGTRRGTNHYFFDNKEAEGDNAPDYTGSARFDIKLNDEDEASVGRAKDRMYKALTELHGSPDIFENDLYVKFASVYLDPARTSDTYEYKSRVLFYSKDYETDEFSIDLDTLMALAFAALTSYGWQGAIFKNDKGYGGSLSVKLDQALYTSICDLCEALGLIKETTATDAPTPHTYTLDNDQDEVEEELFEEYV